MNVVGLMEENSGISWPAVMAGAVPDEAELRFFVLVVLYMNCRHFQGEFVAELELQDHGRSC